MLRVLMALAAAVGIVRATPEDQQAAFVRALVRPPLGFVSLAEDLAGRVPGAAGARLQVEVALLAAEVLLDAREREVRYRRALQLLESGGDPHLVADVCLAYGRFLLAKPGSAPELVLRRGLAACAGAASSRALLLRRGMLLCELARAVESQRADLREHARHAFEDVVLDGRCETFDENAERAMLGLGVLENDERLLRDVIDAMGSALGEDAELRSQPAAAAVLEDAYRALAQLLFTSGRHQDVVALVDEHGRRTQFLGLHAGTVAGDAMRLFGVRSLWALSRRDPAGRVPILAFAQAQAIVVRQGGVGPLAAEARELVAAMREGKP